ncbi:hypothetical protein C4D60_Mb04t29190 [Musa balbisiana]|uniref:Uncharacterized protein n=1 Tax=Musa balbisiana TaxID=52838 RepID=A0A4S8KFG2_MUSBA|nr:hypothetical protein C4D60_Mb04t29190 [Musa balbisiana]
MGDSCALQWPEKAAYEETLLKLAGLFRKNFEVFANYKIGEDAKLAEEILAAVVTATKMRKKRNQRKRRVLIGSYIVRVYKKTSLPLASRLAACACMIAPNTTAPSAHSSYVNTAAHGSPPDAPFSRVYVASAPPSFAAQLLLRAMCRGHCVVRSPGGGDRR